MAPSKPPAPTVTLRGGTVASLAVLQCLWAIEARGGTFVRLEDGAFRVEPPDCVTDAELAFLQAHRDEARQLVLYDADDSHLRESEA